MCTLLLLVSASTCDTSRWKIGRHQSGRHLQARANACYLAFFVSRERKSATGLSLAQIVPEQARLAFHQRPCLHGLVSGDSPKPNFSPGCATMKLCWAVLVSVSTKQKLPAMAVEVVMVSKRASRKEIRSYVGVLGVPHTYIPRRLH